MILTNLPPTNELELLGQQMRQYACSDPCYLPTDCFNPMYFSRIGEDIQVSVTLELFENAKDAEHKLMPPPRWHGSICILHEIESGTDRTFGMPERALLAFFQWDWQKLKMAREILGYLLGPIILGEKQVVQDIHDKFSLHWFTEAHPQTVGVNGTTH